MSEITLPNGETKELGDVAECPACDGDGVVSTDGECSICHGEGKVSIIKEKSNNHAKTRPDKT